MNREIKKIFRFIFPLLILLFGLNWLLIFGARNSRNSWFGKVNQIANCELDPEIMIFGPSVSEVGVDPRILNFRTNYSVYNCSIDGTRYIQLKGIMDQFNSYSKNNKIIVLMETLFTFEPVFGVFELQRYLGQINKDKIFEPLYEIQPDLLWKAKYVPFYNFIIANQGFYKQAWLGYKNICVSESIDTLYGYTPVEKDFDGSGLKAKKKFNIIIDKVIVQKYINSINSFKRKGHSVVIVLTPAFKEILSNYTNTEPLINTLDSVSKITGAKFWNFTNSEIGADRANYYNVSHLNVNGARLFSENLADSINLYFGRSQK